MNDIYFQILNPNVTYSWPCVVDDIEFLFLAADMHFGENLDIVEVFQVLLLKFLFLMCSFYLNTIVKSQ